MKKTTKRNRAAQDTTLINLRALKERVSVFEDQAFFRLKAIDLYLSEVYDRLRVIERTLDKLKGRA